MLKNHYHVVGVMSGTSLDGVDLAEIFFEFKNGQWDYRFGHTFTEPYDDRRDKSWLANLVNLSPAALDEADHSYSLVLGAVINRFIKANNIKALDAVCSHGHTALHQPKKGITRQIGNQKIIAEVLKQTVVCDFRVQDVALGGQGAPLVPIGDRLLFGNYDYCINLGGFANVSYEHNGQRIAYDLCPVNIVLNELVKPLGLSYDDRGQLASQGKLIPDLLAQLNTLSFYAQKPPKSLGLEWVKRNIDPLLSGQSHKTEDLLATLVEHMAMQIAAPLKSDAQVLITGGGTYNDYLLQRIEAHKSLKIKVPERELIEYKEALIFALLGVLKLRGEINCLSSVTGASKDHSSGVIFNLNI